MAAPTPGTGRQESAQAQGGEGYGSHAIGPQSAQGRLSGFESARYRQALSDLAAAPKMDKYGRVKKAKKVLLKHTDAIGTVGRLRGIAAQRAFKDVALKSMQYSKPWMIKAPKGLIGEETVGHSLAGSKYLGGEGAEFGDRDERREALGGERTFGAIGMTAAHNLQPLDTGYPARIQRYQEARQRGDAAYTPPAKPLGFDPNVGRGAQNPTEYNIEQQAARDEAGFDVDEWGEWWKKQGLG